MLTRAIAQACYWTAQGALPLGRGGAWLADGLLERALILDPSLTRARGWQELIRGCRCREAGDMPDAVRHLKEASALLPGNAAALANLGITLCMAGEHDQAVQTIERSMRSERDVTGEPQIWVALTWSYLRSGRSPKALEACERAQEARAVSQDLRLLRALALAACRGFVSRDDLRGLIATRPRMLPMVLEFTQGLAHARSRDLARQVMRCLPDRIQARAYRVMANSALNADDTDTTTWALRECEAREPQSPMVPAMKSEVALRKRDLAAAFKHARDAVERAGRNAAGYEQLARVQLLRGDWEAALAAAREAVERKGTGALSGGILALAALAADQPAEARRLFGVTRTGDVLGVACAAVAQARIRVIADDHQLALRSCHMALAGLRALPDWASTPPVLHPLSQALLAACGVLAARGDMPPQLAPEVRALRDLIQPLTGTPAPAD
jgi:tetratricopeptide (TPR) repeat protein